MIKILIFPYVFKFCSQYKEYLRLWTAAALAARCAKRYDVVLEFVANWEATELHCDEGTSWAPAAALAAIGLYPTVVPVALLPTVLPFAAAAVNHAVVGHVVSGKRYPDNMCDNFIIQLFCKITWVVVVVFWKWEFAPGKLLGWLKWFMAFVCFLS